MVQGEGCRVQGVGGYEKERIGELLRAGGEVLLVGGRRRS
jgi:hypothetical protein